MRIATIIVAIILAAAPIASAQLMMQGYGSGAFSTIPGVPCTNQLVLDYSNSCALIGQGFGQ